MDDREKAKSIVREFLGLEDWQAIPSAFGDLVEEITSALASKGKTP